MQALVYQPVTDSARTALAAVRLAAALITVSKDVVPSAVASGQVHDLAIGLAYGEVLISRIGEHGNTDVVSIGQSTADAAKIQQRLDGGCIGISTGMRDLLPDWLKDAFKWSVSAKAYVARGLDWDDLKTLDEQSEQTDRSTASYRRAASVRPWAAR